MTFTSSTVRLRLCRGSEAHHQGGGKRDSIRLDYEILLPGWEEVRQVFFLGVRVYLPLPGIGSVPAESITSRFLDRSVEIKIHGYNGKNWIFAVPKTQCCVLVKTSKVTQKADKLIISLGKMAESDNWFSLHKVKCIGEKDTDWSIYEDRMDSYDRKHSWHRWFRVWSWSSSCSITRSGSGIRSVRREQEPLRKLGLEWVPQRVFPAAHLLEFLRLLPFRLSSLQPK